LTGGNISVIPSTSEVAIAEFTEFKVDLDLMVLQGNERQGKTWIAVPDYLIFRLRCGLYLKPFVKKDPKPYSL
jgi:hypothetical protein